MWDPKKQTTIEATRCPVCRTYFGKRDCETIFLAHCEECKATFYWKPWAKKPTVAMDKNKPVKCGCGGCLR